MIEQIMTGIFLFRKRVVIVWVLSSNILVFLVVSGSGFLGNIASWMALMALIVRAD